MHTDERLRSPKLLPAVRSIGGQGVSLACRVRCAILGQLADGLDDRTTSLAVALVSDSGNAEALWGAAARLLG